MIQKLSWFDKENFASAHPLFLSAYRDMVVKAKAYGQALRRLDIASHILANYENLTSITIIVDIRNGSPSLHDLKGPPKLNI